MQFCPTFGQNDTSLIKWRQFKTKGGEAMESIALRPFCLDSALTGYLPLPRELLRMEKPATAMLLYAVLLDRATLSQKNRYADKTGHVYVIYPIEKLAEIAHAHGALFHTDAVQAVGHVKIDVYELGVDMLSASAHKFNGIRDNINNTE